ncbi:MAG: hypothetical protein GXY48_12580 [Methanomicrobiales archaeon]|nr:hypothetical protein [Methanomicrobiales archaeon]
MNYNLTESSFLYLILLGLLVSIFLAKDIWFIYIILIPLTAFIWIKSKKISQLNLLMMFCGLQDAFASWFSSPWIAILIVLATFGLFFSRLNLFNLHKEKILFTLLSITIIITGIFLMLVNRILLPTIFISGIIFGFILLAIISELRLQKKYV